VRFVETPVFTRDVVELLPDDEYRNLQLALALRPQAGALIRGSGASARSAGRCLAEVNGAASA